MDSSACLYKYLWLTRWMLADKLNVFCRISSEDYGVMGLRYGTGNLSFGAMLMPFASMWPEFM